MEKILPDHNLQLHNALIAGVGEHPAGSMSLQTE